MSCIFRKALGLALEERSDGKAVKEIEYEFYARVVNTEELTNASRIENHEQWEIKVPKSDKNAVGGRLRVRKTTVGADGKPEYVLTTKTDTKDGNSMEVSVPTTEENFIQFKYISESGMLKTRYVFEVDGSDLVWEIDVYKKPGGGFWEWCKIDLEVDRPDALIPPFPIELADIISGQSGERTEEEENKIKSLYDFEFITKNQFVSD